MGSATSKKEPQWLTILRDIAARNDSIDLATPSSQFAEDSTSWRVRVFKLDEESETKRILIDKPYSVANPIIVKTGMRFLSLLIVQDTRFGFESTVLKRTNVQLNAQKNIPAVWLSWPKRIFTVQRRNYFRVSTISTNLPYMKLAEVDDFQACAKAELQTVARFNNEEIEQPVIPTTKHTCQAFISNISGGGMGAAVESEHASKLQQGKHYWVTFNLPDCPVPLNAVVKCVHLARAKDDMPVKLGLKFVFDHNPAYRNFLVEQVCEFTAWQQRIMLQRRRGG